MNVRVYELSARLGIESKTLLKWLQDQGEHINSAASPLSPALIRAATVALSQPGQRPSSSGMASQSAPKQGGVDRGARNQRSGSVSIGKLNDGLKGSPYSLPPEQYEYIVHEFLPRVTDLESRCTVARLNIAERLAAQLGQINRSSEIYESNRLEGLGPNLRRTDEILRSKGLLDAVDLAVAEQALEETLLADTKTRDVVGLGAAKILANQYVHDRDRPLTETDLRDLHRLILTGDEGGGRYKIYANEISGASHQPTTPVDTPDAMRALINWMRDTHLPLLWKAAVGHAWLTHIHPFHDGNGRLARLLANLVLIGGQYPSLIVRSSSDRGAYLTALGESDGGGDILPLAKVFRRALVRGVTYLERPDFAQQLFLADVESRLNSRYDRWIEAFDNFLLEVSQHLLLHGLNLERVGTISAGDFERLMTGNYRENIWIAKVRWPGKRQDLLLHLSRMSPSSARFAERDQVAPSLFVSIKNQRPLDARAYVPIGHSERRFTHEWTVLMDEPRVFVRHEQRVTGMPIHAAAERAADNISNTADHLIVV